MKRPTFALLVVLALGTLGIAAGIGSFRLGIWDHSGPGAGLFPLLASILIVACTAMRLVSNVSLPAAAFPTWRRLGFYAAALVAFVTLFSTLGFPLTCALALMLMVYFAERRPLLQSAVFAITATAASLVLFDLILQVPLPWGLLAFLRPGA